MLSLLFMTILLILLIVTILLIFLISTILLILLISTNVLTLLMVTIMFLFMFLFLFMYSFVFSSLFLSMSLSLLLKTTFIPLPINASFISISSKQFSNPLKFALVLLSIASKDSDVKTRKFPSLIIPFLPSNPMLIAPFFVPITEVTR